MADVTTQLVTPTMLELSGVQTGANVDQLDQAQGWIVLKSAGGTLPKESAVPGAETKPDPVNKDDAPAATAAPAAVDQTAESPELTALRAELDATKAELEAEKARKVFPPGDDDDEDEEAAAEKALSGIADTATRDVIRKALIEARKDREAMAKMRDDEARRNAAAHVAAHYGHLPVGDGFADVVKALAVHPEWAAVDRVLCAADAAVVAGNEAERAAKGRRLPAGLGEAAGQVETIAKGLLTAGTFQTIEQARAHVYLTNPDLAVAVRAES